MSANIARSSSASKYPSARSQLLNDSAPPSRSRRFWLGDLWASTFPATEFWILMRQLETITSLPRTRAIFCCLRRSRATVSWSAGHSCGICSLRQKPTWTLSLWLLAIPNLSAESSLRQVRSMSFVLITNSRLTTTQWLLSQKHSTMPSSPTRWMSAEPS